MDYGTVERGSFIRRLNRFTAVVQIRHAETICHVKNTGRLGELLLPGAAVYLKYCDQAARKTQWDLLAVEKDGQIINVDSQAPNAVFHEFAAQQRFRTDIRRIRREFTYEDSRFDFCLECETGVQFVEVKGVTLLCDGCAYFPDAPTARGVKHLHGLTRAVGAGYEAAAVFVLQMKRAQCLRPNDATQPAFGQALREAAAAGVRLYAYDCHVTAQMLEIDAPVPVLL